MNTADAGTDGRCLRLRLTESRRQRIIELLPEHGWSITRAGEAAGYSRSYSQTHLPRRLAKDSEFCRQVLDKRMEIEAGSQDRREKALRILDSIIADPSARAADVVRAIEVMGKMLGWMSEKLVLETSDRQQELTEAEQAEAKAIASLRFSTLRPGLPAPDCIEYQTAFEPPPVSSLPATPDGTEPAQHDRAEQGDMP